MSSKERKYSTIDKGGYIYIITHQLPRDSYNPYPTGSPRHADFMGTGLALCGVVKERSQVDPFIDKRQKQTVNIIGNDKKR